ncbi:hypothetical protein ACRALDRAFT_1067098 [Sodiomyces alcalophilus JCM 7366]|uniref:uncharacterized protein n=1 Tax=Sodiomyces alcalophilus JCM 7366 TaxID=591952 RepID=UPI0039B69E1E
MSSSTKTSPPGSTDRGDPEMLATEEQHLRLRSLTWILSHTNAGPVRTNDNSEDGKTGGTFHRARNRGQRFLYENAEMFAFVLERHHESITILPSDRNGSPAYVSRAYEAKPPKLLDHIEIDVEELMAFGQVLGIPMEQVSQDIADPTGWGQDRSAFFVRMSKVAPNDYPAPTDDDPYAVPSGHGQYLMRHVKAQISENIFLTDISFKQHCGNIVDGIQRTHKARNDPLKVSTAHTSLATYVYMASASGIQERLRRGFTEFGFGRYLTIPMKEVLEKNPDACRIPPEVYLDEINVVPLPDALRKLQSDQRTALEDLLHNALPAHGMVHEDFDPEAPGNLLERPEFYDTHGRIMFHTLLTTVMSRLTEEVNSLVQAKRAAMEAQAAVNRGEGDHISEARREELANKVTHHAKTTSAVFKMLDALRANFEWAINSHMTWLCRIFGDFPEDYDYEAGCHPQGGFKDLGLFDEFAPLCRDIFERGWPVSCVHWLKLLCLPEASMKMLCRPLLRPTSRDNVVSAHVSNCRVVYLGITPAAHKTRMMPIKQCLQSMNYTSVEISDVIESLVAKGSIPSAEAVEKAEFQGCVHAEALQTLLMSLKTQKERLELSPEEVAAWNTLQSRRESNQQQQQEQRQKKQDLIWLPKTAITSRILKDRAHGLVSNSPFCAGCRAILNYVAKTHVLDGNTLLHRGSRANWTQFDLPPWTPRDVMQAALEEAEAEVGTRIKDILDLAEHNRSLAAMDPDTGLWPSIEGKDEDGNSQWEDCDMDDDANVCY